MLAGCLEDPGRAVLVVAAVRSAVVAADVTDDAGCCRLVQSLDVFQIGPDYLVAAVQSGSEGAVVAVASSLVQKDLVSWRSHDLLVVVFGSVPQCHDDVQGSHERSLLSSEGFPGQSGSQQHFFFVQKMNLCHQIGLMGLWGVFWKNVRTWDLLSVEKSRDGQSCCHDDDVPVALRKIAVAGCTHPAGSTPLEAHHNHGKCVCCVCLWMSDFRYHDVWSDQNGPPVVSQTNQSPLGPNGRLHCQILHSACHLQDKDHLVYRHDSLAGPFCGDPEHLAGSGWSHIGFSHHGPLVCPYLFPCLQASQQDLVGSLLLNFGFALEAFHYGYFSATAP